MLMARSIAGHMGRTPPLNSGSAPGDLYPIISSPAPSAPPQRHCTPPKRPSSSPKATSRLSLLDPAVIITPPSRVVVQGRRFFGGRRSRSSERKKKFRWPRAGAASCRSFCPLTFVLCLCPCPCPCPCHCPCPLTLSFVHGFFRFLEKAVAFFAFPGLLSLPST